MQGLTGSIGSKLRAAHPGEAPIASSEGAVATPLELPVDHIRVEGVNVRTYFDEEAMDQLAASMQRHGLLQPIIVAPEPDADNRWRLIAGERRLRAAKNLGWTSIPVRILPIAPEKWKAVMMTENTLREDFTLGEEIEGYSLLRDELGSVEAVADLLGVTRGYLHPLLRIWRHSRAREAIADGTIQSKAVARVLSLLVDNKGQERVPGALDKAIAFCADKHPTKARLQTYVDELLHRVPQSDQEEAVRPAKSRYSFLTQEEQRINKVATEVIPALSAVELRELRQMYQALLARIDNEAPGGR